MKHWSEPKVKLIGFQLFIPVSHMIDWTIGERWKPPQWVHYMVQMWWQQAAIDHAPIVHDLQSGFAIPDSNIHGAYMGPTWGRQAPGGPHVGPMNLAIRDGLYNRVCHPDRYY